jgi:hypothetical protein
MSAKGQNAKHSNRANAFRITPELRHCSEQLACLKGAKTGRDPAWTARLFSLRGADVMRRPGMSMFG